MLIGVAIEVPPAIADAHKLPGTAVPDDELASVVAAATSCPTLTAPRVAAQLMALTGFSTTASGSTIAGMTDTDWTHWKPRSAADRDDTGDNIVALAHQTCQMVGQLRQAGLDGDLWGPAIAAQHGGVDAVIAAKGVPGGQKTLVDNAIGYAAWYADQPQFDPDAATPAPSPSAEASAVTDAAVTTAVTVPATLVSAINRAGSTCSAVTPARIAAQLRAASNFDANLRTDQGEGIAQFSPALWAQYAGKGDSVWDADDAIAVLGETMCDLTHQFSGLTGADPYTLALGAFQWGAYTIRQGAGLPATTIVQLADTVKSLEGTYQKDARLNGNTAATPPASASARASASPSPSASLSPSPSSGQAQAKAPTVSTKPTPGKTARDNQPPVKGPDTDGSGRSYGPYFIYNFATKECVDLPGYGAGTRDGPVNQFPCAKTGTDNQEFTFVPRSVDGDGYQLYWIRNVDDGWCVDPPGTSTVTSSTSLDETGCYDADNQYFRLEPRFTSGGFQYYWLRNTVANMCLDVPGKADGGADARLALVPCLANDDHDWALVQKSEW